MKPIGTEAFAVYAVDEHCFNEDELIKLVSVDYEFGDEWYLFQSKERNLQQMLKREHFNWVNRESIRMKSLRQSVQGSNQM